MQKQELFNQFQSYVTENILSFFSQKETEQFKLYFDEIIEWNQKMNLISFKTENDLIYRHFCDSLYSAKAIMEINNIENLKVADIGTGSGMPGIPVKIVLPTIDLTLIESITKKCLFLENVNKKLNYNIKVLNKRAEEIGQKPKYRQSFDIVLSRAVSKFSPNLEIAIPLLKIGGHFIVHKTKNSAESPDEGLPSVKNALGRLGAELEKIIPYKLPENDLDYCILIFKKTKDTPKEFPRKIGIPEKKPL